jgi:hypothetical protein
MTGKDLTTAQLQRLQAIVWRYHRFFVRLTDRMNRKGFLPGDPLLVKAFEAQRAIHALLVELHYLTVKMGLGDDKEDHWSKAMGNTDPCA